MKSKVITILIFFQIFLLLLEYSPGRHGFSRVSSPAVNDLKQTDKSEYTYERVYRDGIWWIEVYDEDGRLVDVYPDTDQNP